MSDTTTEEILAKATPRPWELDEYEVYSAINGRFIAGISNFGDEDLANRELTVLAVNSYEKQRECISGLITEARQVINTFWETYEYRDKYTDNDCTKALEHLEAAVARAEELLK